MDWITTGWKAPTVLIVLMLLGVLYFTGVSKSSNGQAIEKAKDGKPAAAQTAPTPEKKADAEKTMHIVKFAK